MWHHFADQYPQAQQVIIDTTTSQPLAEADLPGIEYSGQLVSGPATPHRHYSR